MQNLSLELFKKRLSRHLKLELELIVNENRSTMLNILSRSKERAKVSIHRMFLDAPEDVISAIAHYVRGTRREKHTKDLLIRGYIQTNLPRFDYSNQLDKSKFETSGLVYDLQEIYDRLNKEYFNNEFDLGMTWYGAHGRKNRSRVTFGQYFDHLKLIKIHRVLDDHFFPPFFVDFVVYHEMLHHVVPGYVDEKGLYRVHGEEFKMKETEFAEYKKATQWEKDNRDHFFKLR